MGRNMNRKWAWKARGAVGAVLLSAAAALPLLALAQTSADKPPDFKPPAAEAPNGGFTLTPGNVDTAGWTDQNKVVTVNFTLERADRQLFRRLRVEDIAVKLNGESVPLKPDALGRGRDVKVVFMVDRSGSMVDPRESGGADKLRAAREALRHIVTQLDAGDQASIGVFDIEQAEIVPLTSDPRALERGINSIATRHEDTNLYDAIRYALDKARASEARLVVFLSDGMEDTEAAKTALAEGRLVSFKRSHEQQLGRVAREHGIRFFSIAVGEPGSLETLKGVDFNTLKEISGVTNGGYAKLIDVAKLNRQAAGNTLRMTESLTSELKDVLTEMRKLWRSEAALRVALPGLREGQGELQLDLNIEHGDKRVTLPVVYSYTWDKSQGPPIFSPGRLLTPIFIDIKPPIEWTGLTQIYLLLLSPLVLLGLLPSVLNRIAAAREMSRMSHAIEQIGPGSPLQGKLCPNEIGPGGQRFLFKPGDTVLVCPRCHTAHHLSCWEYNQHQCMNRVCEYQFEIPQRVLARHGVVAGRKGQYV